jgi:hypothetical protein
MNAFHVHTTDIVAIIDHAVRLEDGHWASFDDAPQANISDFDAPYKVPDDITSSAFYFICCVYDF